MRLSGYVFIATYSWLCINVSASSSSPGEIGHLLNSASTLEKAVKTGDNQQNPPGPQTQQGNAPVDTRKPEQTSEQAVKKSTTDGNQQHDDKTNPGTQQLVKVGQQITADLVNSTEQPVPSPAPEMPEAKVKESPAAELPVTHQRITELKEALTILDEENIERAKEQQKRESKIALMEEAHCKTHELATCKGINTEIKKHLDENILFRKEFVKCYALTHCDMFSNKEGEPKKIEAQAPVKPKVDLKVEEPPLGPKEALLAMQNGQYDTNYDPTVKLQNN